MKFTGTQMRNELKFVMDALRLQERFIKETDPTIVVGKAIEEISLKLSSLSQLYKDQTQNRNAMVPQAKNLIADIESIANEAFTILNTEKEPEDNNRSV